MMYRVVAQTREERVAMYMRTNKKELVEMLINNQDLLTKILKLLK